MKKIGIFYTNNEIPKQVIDASLESIKIASENSKVPILASSWEHIEGFENYICDIKNRGHFSLYYQIIKLLMIAKERNFESVSFLEHDVLYGPNYFEYPLYNGNVLANNNYIGLCSKGYQKKPAVSPLHQLTMKIDYAIDYFSKEFINCIHKQVTTVEPNTEYDYWNSQQNSIHINWGGNFTSHFQTFGEVYSHFDDYWGHYNQLIDSNVFKDI